jgi:hypothetical protein
MTASAVALPGVMQGVRLAGSLNSPAGKISSITVDICNAQATEDLLIKVCLHDKQPTARAELLALALPFTVNRPAFSVDVGGAMMRVDADQLPDANRDEHPAISGWVLGEQDSSRCLAVSSAEVFLWHFGGLRYCDWNRTTSPRDSLAYAHLFNNVWNTNFRCWLGGDLSYTIRIRRADEDHLNILRQMAEHWAVVEVC